MQDAGPYFQGDRDACLRAVSGLSQFYTYILRRPDGRPFYVGKGKGPRVLNHENEARHPNDRRSNSHKLNVIRSIWVSGRGIGYEIDKVFDDETGAYAREEHLISTYKRLHEGGPLTNRASGGGSESAASPFSKERHAATLSGVPEDDPETAILNTFILSIGPMRSVVFKPISRFRPRPTQVFPRVRRKPTLRQAVALAASASANGLVLHPGVEIPRRATVDGVEAFVENGVSCDIATSGFAEILPSAIPADERFRLTDDGLKTLTDWIGQAKLDDLGISG